MHPLNIDSSRSEGTAPDSLPDADQDETAFSPGVSSGEESGGGGASPPSPNSADSSPSEDHSASLRRVESLLTDLDRKFERRLQTDQHKNALFDQLHAELQEHRNGLIQKLIQPMLVDLIRLYDDVSALVSQYDGEEPAVRRALRPFASLPGSIIETLERNQTEIFNEPAGDPFNPARHKVLKKIPTGDPAADKTIAESVRPGFEWNGRIIRPQMVNVNIYSPPESVPGDSITPVSISPR